MAPTLVLQLRGKASPAHPSPCLLRRPASGRPRRLSTHRYTEQRPRYDALSNNLSLVSGQCPPNPMHQSPQSTLPAPNQEPEPLPDMGPTQGIRKSPDPISLYPVRNQVSPCSETSLPRAHGRIYPPPKPRMSFGPLAIRLTLSLPEDGGAMEARVGRVCDVVRYRIVARPPSVWTRLSCK